MWGDGERGEGKGERGIEFEAFYRSIVEICDLKMRQLSINFGKIFAIAGESIPGVSLYNQYNLYLTSLSVKNPADMGGFASTKSEETLTTGNSSRRRLQAPELMGGVNSSIL